MLGLAPALPGASVGERRVHEHRRVIAELAHHAIMIGLFERYRLEPVLRQAQQRRAGIRHQHWRMRGHDDLAMADVFHLPHQFQQFDLARGRQGGFRFVEDEDALPLAAFVEEAQKTLAVGMGEKVRRRAAASRFAVDLVEV